MTRLNTDILLYSRWGVVTHIQVTRASRIEAVRTVGIPTSDLMGFRPNHLQQINDNTPITWQSKVKKDAYFSFCWHFEYIILLMLIVFLDMCPNSYGWMPSL